jgi:hypothetical protein
MTYTKTQLIDGFCEMRGYNAETDGTKLEFIAKIEAKVQERLDRRLAEIPTSARIAMRDNAVAYLANKELEQVKLDNADGEL